MTDLTNQWYQAIRISPVESEEETTASTAQLSCASNNTLEEVGKKKSPNSYNGPALNIQLKKKE